MSGYIYFALAEFGEEQFAKIGFAKNIRKRLSQIQTGCPAKIEMLGYLPGDRKAEANLHRQCAAHRVFGEWFRIDGPVFHLMILCCDNQHRAPV